jgi:hypothetical protein
VKLGKSDRLVAGSAQALKQPLLLGVSERRGFSGPAAFSHARERRLTRGEHEHQQPAPQRAHRPALAGFQVREETGAAGHAVAVLGDLDLASATSGNARSWT